MSVDQPPIRNPVVQAVFRSVVALIVAIALGSTGFHMLPRQARCALHHPACEGHRYRD